MIGGIAKRGYVAIIRGLRLPAEKLGLLNRLESSSERGTALWLRSLFAIYDLEDLVTLNLAWWTLDAVEIIDQFLRSRPDARVFEYGSGASTIWLGMRAGEVHSVEHDEPWMAQVNDHIGAYPNIRLYAVPPEPCHPNSEVLSQRQGWTEMDFEKYVAQLKAVDGMFDLIVIDGRARNDCLSIALDHIKPDGLILFDNSKRPRYRHAIDNSGLASFETTGLTACLPLPDATTLLSPNPALFQQMGLTV